MTHASVTEATVQAGRHGYVTEVSVEHPPKGRKVTE